MIATVMPRVRAEIAQRIHNLFSRKRWRRVQQLLHVRRIHHPRWAFGWALPIGEWVLFERRVYEDDLGPGGTKTHRGHLQQCPRSSYHDSTTTGVY